MPLIRPSPRSSPALSNSSLRSLIAVFAAFASFSATSLMSSSLLLRPVIKEEPSFSPVDAKSVLSVTAFLVALRTETTACCIDVLFDEKPVEIAPARSVPTSFISPSEFSAMDAMLLITVLTLDVIESADVPFSLSQKDTRSSAKFNIYVPRDGKYVISIWRFESLKFANAFTTPTADLTVAILSSPNVPSLSTKLLRFEATVVKSLENTPRPLSPNIFLVHSAWPSIFFDASAKAVITEHAYSTDSTCVLVIVPSLPTKSERFSPASGRSPVNTPSPLSPNIVLAHSACPSISLPAFASSSIIEHAILTESK